MTYEDLKKANEEIKVTRLVNKKTGKEIGDYAEVNERVKVFRMLFPEGFIKTDILKLENGFCLMEAKVGYYLSRMYQTDKSIYNELEEKILATGTAYEKEESSFINQTSYIENCETSAVGRALAMLGIGIEKSIASAEEVSNAVLNQDDEVTEEKARAYVFGGKKHPGQTIEEIYKEGDIKFLEWCIYSDKTTEFVKKAIELLTPVRRINKEEQEKRLKLINEIKEQHAFVDMDDLLEAHHVKDLSQIPTEELEMIVNG